MKRSLSLLLASTLTLGLLSGCGNSEKPEDTLTDDTKTPPITEPTDKTPVELTLWNTSTELTDFEISLQDDFTSKNPHITIKNIIKEGDPGNDFYTAVSSGNAPDLVKSSFTVMEKYMDSGILEPLDSYFESWEGKDAFDQTYVDQFTKDGELLGLTAWSGAFFFGYNKDLYAQAGIDDAPTTWEEALADAELISALGTDIIGYATLTAEWTEWFFQYYVWQAGGDLTTLNEDGTLNLTFTDPAVIAAGEYYQDLRAAGVLQSDLTLKFSDIQDKFAQGKIGMMPFGGDWLSIMVGKGMNPNDIGLCLFPMGPGEEYVTTDLGQAYVINKKTTQEKKDAAWEYIAYMNSVETLTKRTENKMSNGVADIITYPRNDFDLVSIAKLPDEYTDVIEGSKNGRFEFEGKAIIGAYVDRAVQSILIDPNADVATEFQKAQDAAQKEVIDAYNAKIIAGE